MISSEDIWEFQEIEGYPCETVQSVWSYKYKPKLGIIAEAVRIHKISWKKYTERKKWMH